MTTNDDPTATDERRCPTCGAYVPPLSFLSARDHTRVLALIDAGQAIEAIKTLRDLGIAELKHANAWVFHRGQPIHPEAHTAPCPHCGMPLRTPTARQCRHCGRDWH